MTPTAGLAPTVPPPNSVPPANYYDCDPYTQLPCDKTIDWHATWNLSHDTPGGHAGFDITAAIYRRIFGNLKKVTLARAKMISWLIRIHLGIDIVSGGVFFVSLLSEHHNCSTLGSGCGWRVAPEIRGIGRFPQLFRALKAVPFSAWVERLWSWCMMWYHISPRSGRPT